VIVLRRARVAEARARVVERDWPALLIGAACIGLAASVWVRPPWMLLAGVTSVALVAALAASDNRRLALAGVALLVAGLWWGALRCEALDQSYLADRIGETASGQGR